MIHPAPKPAPTVKHPKPLRRTSSLSKGPRTPLAKINVEQTKRREAKRAKDRRSPEEKAAREAGWVRANGICECGCGLSFDTSDGSTGDGYPEWHHDNYRKRIGRWLRRWCHQFLEMTKYPHRAARRKAAA